MQLTRGADYAVRVMVHLAGLPEGRRATRADLATEGGVPEHFLGKILQTLAKGGLVNSHRGASGGYTIARAPGAITLLDVIELLDGAVCLNACVAERPGCNRLATCRVHGVWMEAQAALTSVLRSATLDRFVAGTREGQSAFCGGGEWS
jgi:Rrf2 family protein